MGLFYQQTLAREEVLLSISHQFTIQVS